VHVAGPQVGASTGSRVQDITVRQMDFEFPADMDPMIIAGAPEESYWIVGLSLLLPYLEPYLIRTMKQAKKHVASPDLRADLEKFSAQEGQHYRQHIRFNDVIRAWGFPKLRELEEKLDADYRRFTETKSLRWNLAYAEGFEALTTAAARFTFQVGANDQMHPAARDLFTWHLVEEFEHRTVAFDVYDHVCGSYAYRMIFGSYAQWHMGRWIVSVMKYMLEADPRVESEFGGVQGRKQRTRAQLGAMRKHLLPKVLWTCMPWYTPHDIEMTDELKAIASAFSQRAVKTS
jgi:predicted metal-dependent hydrolase